MMPSMLREHSPASSPGTNLERGDRERFPGFLFAVAPFQGSNPASAGGPRTFSRLYVRGGTVPRLKFRFRRGTANAFPAFCSRWQPPAPLGCGWQLLRSICAHCVRSGPPTASFVPPASRPVQCRRTRFSHFVRALANILLHLHLARSAFAELICSGPLI